MEIKGWKPCCVCEELLFRSLPPTDGQEKCWPWSGAGNFQRHTPAVCFDIWEDERAWPQQNKGVPDLGIIELLNRDSANITSHSANISAVFKPAKAFVTSVNHASIGAVLLKFMSLFSSNLPAAAWTGAVHPSVDSALIVFSFCLKNNQKFERETWKKQDN